MDERMTNFSCFFPCQWNHGMTVWGLHADLSCHAECFEARFLVARCPQAVLCWLAFGSVPGTRPAPTGDHRLCHPSAAVLPLVQTPAPAEDQQCCEAKAGLSIQLLQVSKSNIGV